MHVSLAPEKLFSLGPIAFTNSMFTALIVAVLIIVMVLIFNIKYNYAKPGKFQLAIEMMVQALFDLIKDILGIETAKRLFGFLFTFFMLILVSNLFGLLPFVPNIGFGETAKETAIETEATSQEEAFTVHAEEAATKEAEHEAVSTDLSFGSCLKERNCYLTITGVHRFEESIHLFRAPSSDLSFTVALALISVVVTNILGFANLKLGYLKKFFNFSNPIAAFVGILELVSEFSRLISFSFRLFGNIFAGELLLVVITGLSFGVATLPFLFLELFVSFIQALVFFILTSIFIGLAVAKHEGH